MKIYRTTVRAEEEGSEMKVHNGFRYYLSKSEAKKMHKQEGDEAQGDSVEELELSMNKWDVISFLNAYCAHPDNG